MIALSSVDREFLLSHLSLSTRGCHYRISRLLRAGVITRKNGKYSVTSFGLLVHHAQNLIGLALNSYWKLSAIDSLESSHSIPRHEYNKIVSNLLSDDKIKEILTRERATTNSVDPGKSINSIPPEHTNFDTEARTNNLNLKGKKSFQCLTALDDLDYFPLDSISDDILYRSIKESLEPVGKTYAKAVIDHICHINRLSEREILTNCDLFEDSMYRLFGRVRNLL